MGKSRNIMRSILFPECALYSERAADLVMPVSTRCCARSGSKSKVETMRATSLVGRRRLLKAVWGRTRKWWSLRRKLVPQMVVAVATPTHGTKMLCSAPTRELIYGIIRVFGLIS